MSYELNWKIDRIQALNLLNGGYKYLASLRERTLFPYCPICAFASSQFQVWRCSSFSSSFLARLPCSDNESSTFSVPFREADVPEGVKMRLVFFAFRK